MTRAAKKWAGKPPKSPPSTSEVGCYFKLQQLYRRMRRWLDMQDGTGNSDV